MLQLSHASLLTGLAAHVESARASPQVERLLWLALLGALAISLVIVRRQFDGARRALKTQARETLDALGRLEGRLNAARKELAVAKQAQRTAEIGEAQHRKRLFSAHKELKALAQDAEARLSAVRAEQARPAFEEATRPAPRPRARPEDATPDHAACQKEATALRTQLSAMQNASDEAQRALRQGALETRALKKRIEDLRRIDLIGKNKLALAEDRLVTLGRQYYDAVSELAAARGQIPSVHSQEPTHPSPPVHH